MGVKYNIKNSCVKVDIAEGAPYIRVLFVNGKTRAAWKTCRITPIWDESFIIIYLE